MPHTVHDERARLGFEADSFNVENNISQPTPANITKAKILLKQLESMYDTQLYERLSRSSCADIDS